MAYPQLSGRMVRLNGTNQNLIDYYPDPISWNKVFLRIAYNPSTFPGIIGYVLDFVTYGGCLLRVHTINERWIRWVLATTAGYIEINERIEISAGLPDDEQGPLHSTLAWDGTNMALYIGNRRAYIDSFGGVFSGPTPHMVIGSRYENLQYFMGDVGHIILHNDIPAPYVGLPEHVYDGELTATEFLRVHGLTESNVLILYDWRENSGKNYGSGGSAYNLTPQNNPTFLDNNFQYVLIDEIPPFCEVSLNCNYSPAQIPPAIFTFEADIGGPPPPEGFTWQWSRDRGANWNSIPGGGPQFTFDSAIHRNIIGEYWVRASAPGDTSGIVKVQIIDPGTEPTIYYYPSRFLHGRIQKRELKGHVRKR